MGDIFLETVAVADLKSGKSWERQTLGMANRYRHYYDLCRFETSKTYLMVLNECNDSTMIIIIIIIITRFKANQSKAVIKKVKAKQM